MNKKNILVLSMLLGTILTLLFIFFSIQKKNELVENEEITALSAPEASDSALDFELNDNFDQKTQLYSYKGNVILLSFWASWCGPCMSEIPYMIRLFHEYKDKNFKLILVNLEEEPLLAISEIKNKLEIPFPMYYSQENKASDLYQVSAIPHNLVLDKNMKIRFVEKGPRNWYSDEIKNLINGLL